ncbi:unnamed protein product, partial [Peniophora sp. CBMAI 1063]
MSTPKAIETMPPLWARDLLSDPSRTVDEVYATAGYLKEPLREVDELLRRDPHGFIRVWLTAYRERSPCGLRNPVLWGLTRTLSVFAHSALIPIDIEVADTRYRPSKPWLNLLDAGLCSLCLEAVSSEDFFNEFSNWVLDMMKVMEAILGCFQAGPRFMQEKSRLCDDICELALGVWERCSTHRDIFIDGNRLERAAPGVPRQLRMLLRNMLGSYLHAKRDVLTYHPDSPEFLSTRELYLMCWFYRDEPWRDAFEMLGTVVFASLIEEHDELRRFIEQEVFLKYGAESYLKRLTVTVETVDTNDPNCHPLLASCIALQRTVLTHEGFRPYLLSSGLVRSLCEMVRREGRRQNIPPDHAHLHLLIIKSVQGILSYLTKYVSECIAALVREHDVLDIIARGILTLCSSPLEYVDTLASVEICGVYEDVGRTLAARSTKNSLRKDYKRRLRREWYPLLKSLDSVIAQQRIS